MKVFNTVMKVVAALAAIAGAVYVVATYGDRIVAWAKRLWTRLPQCPITAEPEDIFEDAPAAEPTEESTVESAETPAAEEADATEADFAEEAPAPQEEAPSVPVADEADFEA